MAEWLRFEHDEGNGFGRLDGRSIVVHDGDMFAGARATGATLELRWRGGDVAVLGDRVALAQALDNLIVNAIEHGGPKIRVECECRGARLIASVADRGRPLEGRGGVAELGLTEIERRASRSRGHGLSVVRRTAAEHRGRFVLSRSGAGTRAALELPLAEASRPAA